MRYDRRYPDPSYLVQSDTCFNTIVSSWTFYSYNNVLGMHQFPLLIFILVLHTQRLVDGWNSRSSLYTAPWSLAYSSSLHRHELVHGGKPRWSGNDKRTLLLSTSLKLHFSPASINGNLPCIDTHFYNRISSLTPIFDIFIPMPLPSVF